MLSRPVHLVVTCVVGTAGGDATRRSGAARGQGRAGAAPRPGHSATESPRGRRVSEPRAHMEALKKNPLRQRPVLGFHGCQLGGEVKRRRPLCGLGWARLRQTGGGAGALGIPDGVSVPWGGGPAAGSSSSDLRMSLARRAPSERHRLLKSLLRGRQGGGMGLSLACMFAATTKEGPVSPPGRRQLG